MDFDDLDDAQAALGPSPAELREELLKKQVPEDMPGARRHPRPQGKGFGQGQLKLQKLLYLYGPGSNAKMAERQVAALFKNVPWIADFKLFDWHYFEGDINNKVEEIHADPAVAALFIPYGNKCGSTYDGYLSYVFMANESHNTESWLGPDGRMKFFAGKELSHEAGDGHEAVMDKLARHLEETGPYDGICGFDMGGCLAFEAARLAQEQDPRFVGKFRYLMLFSVRGHKEMALMDQGKLRPKAPLQIPTFVGWSQEDDSKQHSHYEDMCLYVHPKYRGVFYHDQGHRPPNVQKGTTQCAELDAFVGAMQADVQYNPTDSQDVKNYQDFWLPLLREPLTQVPSGAAFKLVVVPDPLGEHGPRPEEAADRMRFPAQEAPETCVNRLAAYRFVTATTFADVRSAIEAAGLSVETIEVEFTDEIRKLAWHPEVAVRDVSVAYAAGQGRSRWLQPEDELSLPWVDVRRAAESLLETVQMGREEYIGFIGFGTGAAVAFALAEAMVNVRTMIPARLWMVCPPTVWPCEGAPAMGQLVTTPIRYLTNPTSVAGPPWRLETSTFGPFSHAHFETKDSMLQILTEDLQQLGSDEA